MGLIASAHFGDHDKGYRLGKMACDLIERRGLKHFGGRTYFRFASWFRGRGRFRGRIDPTRRAFQMAKEHGRTDICRTVAGRSLVSLLLAVGPSTRSIRARGRAGIGVRAAVRVLSRQDLRATRAGPNATWKDREVRLARRRSVHGAIVRGAPHGSSHLRLPGMLLLDPKAPGSLLRRRLRVGGRCCRQGRESWYATSAALALFMTEMADFHFYAALSRAASCEPTGPDHYDKHQRST